MFSLKERFRAWALTCIEKQTEQIVSVQKFFGLPHSRGLIHYFFVAITFLAHEICFVTVLPLMFFCSGPEMAIRESVMWSWLLFYGNFLKEYFCLPRPSSPRIYQFDKSYADEFGFPSTHTTTSMFITIYLSYYLYTRYTNCLPLHLMLGLSSAYLACICLSRIYLGLHTPFDIYGGVIVGFSLVLTFISVGDHLVVWASNSATVFLWYPVYAIFVLAIFPREKKDQWTSTYGDATRALGSSIGVLFGAYFAYPGMTLQVAKVPMVFPITPHDWFFLLARIFVGFAVLVVAKEGAKFLSFKFVPHVVAFLHVAPAHIPKVPNNQRYVIEIPCLLITYTVASFSVAGLTDGLLFKYLGLLY